MRKKRGKKSHCRNNPRTFPRTEESKFSDWKVLCRARETVKRSRPTISCIILNFRSLGIRRRFYRLPGRESKFTIRDKGSEEQTSMVTLEVQDNKEMPSES